VNKEMGDKGPKKPVKKDAGKKAVPAASAAKPKKKKK
jgi:hypothetical protein